MMSETKDENVVCEQLTTSTLHFSHITIDSENFQKVILFRGFFLELRSANSFGGRSCNNCISMPRPSLVHRQLHGSVGFVLGHLFSLHRFSLLL